MHGIMTNRCLHTEAFLCGVLKTYKKKKSWEKIETLIFIPSSRAEFFNLGRIALRPDTFWWCRALCAFVGI